MSSVSKRKVNIISFVDKILSWLVVRLINVILFIIDRRKIYFRLLITSSLNILFLITCLDFRQFIIKRSFICLFSCKIIFCFFRVYTPISLNR